MLGPRRVGRVAWAMLVGALWATWPAPRAMAAVPRPGTPTTIQLFGYDRSTGKVAVYADGPLRGRGFALHAPERWVYDIQDARYKGHPTTLDAMPGGGVQQVRIGQFTASTVRVVFVLDQAREILPHLECQHTRGGDRFRILFDMPSGPRTDRSAARDTRSGSVPGGPVTRVAVKATPNPEVPTTDVGKPVSALPRGAGKVEDALPPEPTADTLQEPVSVPVSGLTLRRTGKSWIMKITADRPIDYRLARLGRRDRLFVDLLGGAVELPKDSLFAENGLMARIRKGPAQGQDTRLVLELDQPMRYEAHLSDDRRSVIIGLARSEPHQVPGTREDRITIDAGHGGLDPGTHGPSGIAEKDLTLAIATRLGKVLLDQGYDVQYTRTRDTELMLRPRVEMGDEFKSDAFVSIHLNASRTNPSTQGIETYWFAPQSLPLARAVHKALVGALKQPDRGVRRNNFVVVKYNKVPAVLVEVGYLTSPREEQLLAAPDYQQRAVDAIAAGLGDYLRQHGSRQIAANR